MAVKVEVPAAPGNPNTPRQFTVVPDGWFQLSVAGGPPYSLSLELDRGTEEQKTWRRKVAALCAWAEGPYQEAFQTDNLTIAVVTATDARRDTLRTWTARELKERNLERLSPIFLFTSASPVATPPDSFFFDALWYPVGAGAPEPLLDQPTIATRQPSRERQEAVVPQL